MRYRSAGVWVALVALSMAPDTDAQEKSVNVSFGGGWTAPNSDVRDRFGDGYNVNFGVQVNVTPVIGIEGLYSFNGLGEKQISIPVAPAPFNGAVPTDFFANMNMQYGTVSLVAQKPDGAVRPYGLVGGGLYYRPVEITSPAVGWVPGYCDPWWYVCYPGGFVEVDNIIGERSSTDFGMTLGGGVNFGTFYGELRYHFIWGPEVQVSQPAQPIAGVDADTRKADGQFLQATFGFRF